MRASHVAAAALALASGACFSPAFDDGQFACSPDGDCPPGFDCVAGMCVRVGEPDDAGPAADAPTDAAAGPDAAVGPDARPPQPARVYELELETDTWTYGTAEEFFAGSFAPSYADVRSMWSHCGSVDAAILCVGTAAGWHCTNDDALTWFGAQWGSLHEDLKDFPPTFVTAFGGGGGGLFNRVTFSSDERWWQARFVTPPMRISGAMGDWFVNVTTAYSDDGRDTYAAEWSSIDGTPANGSSVTADFTIGSDWTLWDAVGIEYSLEADVWATPRPAPFLALPGAPPPELVVEAAVCTKTLYVLTAGD